MEVATTHEARVVVTTVSDPSDAERMARILVDERLAACVSVLPGVRSTYRWEGRVETENELLLWIKTTGFRIDELREHLLRIHPYDVPEFLVLSVDQASPGYLRWLLDSTGRSGDGDGSRDPSPRMSKS